MALLSETSFQVFFGFIPTALKQTGANVNHNLLNL